MVVKFCLDAMSPSSVMVEETEMRYLLIAEEFGKLCDCATGDVLSGERESEASWGGLFA